MNKNETLQIEGVDLDLLEKQRKALNALLFRIEEIKGKRPITNTQINWLKGLEAMLDAWSDKRYYEGPQNNSN